jgi:hypothetical protein
LNKRLVEDLSKFQRRKITNKIRIEAWLFNKIGGYQVLVEYGIKLFGHWDTKSYAKYVS